MNKHKLIFFPKNFIRKNSIKKKNGHGNSGLRFTLFKNTQNFILIFMKDCPKNITEPSVALLMAYLYFCFPSI